jgi:hypothetical protein
LPLITLVGFVLGFGTVAVVLTAEQARAVTCTDLGHGVTTDNTIQTGYGNRVGNPGIAVRNTSLNCVRVSSVLVVDTGNASTFAEVGWNDTCGDALVCGGPCDEVTSPHVLVYRTINGTPTCKPGTPSTPVTSEPTDGSPFKVSNPDHDNTFEYFYENVSQGSYFIRISHGFLFGFVGERHNSNDSAWGHHNELSYLGTAGNWNFWSNTHGTSDVEPDYYYCHYSDKNVASKQVC